MVSSIPLEVTKLMGTKAMFLKFALVQQPWGIITPCACSYEPCTSLYTSSLQQWVEMVSVLGPHGVRKDLDEPYMTLA